MSDVRCLRHPSFRSKPCPVDVSQDTFSIRAMVSFSNNHAFPSMIMFPNRGQGTFSVFSQEDTTELFFDLAVCPTEGYLIQLRVSPEKVTLCLRQDGKLQPRLEETRPGVGLDLQYKTRYWMSLDSRSGTLRYGKYFPNQTLVLFEAFLKPRAASQGRANVVWDNSGCSQLEKVSLVQVTHKGGDGITPLEPSYDPLPVLCDPLPIITPPRGVSLGVLAGGKYTLPSSLHPACQELYQHISENDVSLDDDDFPDFSKAIQYSIDTKGCMIYNMLRQKAVIKAEQREATKTEMEAVLPEDLRAQYLRITLACHKGTSPGVPFVLEIWPGFHHSAVHDHDGACAVIKVLHGDINCQWYKSLDPARRMGEEVTFKEGQLTWMSPQYYQIHQLHNRTPTVCCTIQCYQYPKEVNPENEPDGGFHFVNQYGRVSRFEPNSDMEYQAFRDRIKQEWTAHVDHIKEHERYGVILR